ncbi:MAG: hypothetical protein AB1847_05930 [bacterium]
MKKFVLVSLLLGFILSAGRVQATSTGFQNAGFEDGNLQFWNPSGVVTISEGDDFTRPFEGRYMAMISSPAKNGGGYVYDNYLSQDLDTSIGTISFWYNFFTRDYDLDDPGFALSINNSDIFSLRASDADVEYHDPVWTTGWRQFSYDLSALSGTITVNLSIFGGNTGSGGGDDDNTLNSWVYIDSAEPVFTPGPAAPIPEPGTMALFLCVGFFFLFMFLGQRQKLTATK